MVRSIYVNQGRGANPKTINRKFMNVIPDGVYAEGPTRLTATGSVGNGTITAKSGLVVLTTDTAHGQVTEEITSDVVIISGVDLSANSFLMASYTYSTDVTTKPTFFMDSSVANGVMISRIRDDGAGVIGFSNSVKQVLGSDRNKMRMFANLSRGG